MTASSLPQTFYVYVHRKATTGAIFYVGKGSRRRAWKNEARNNLWLKTVEKHGHTVEIVLEFSEETLAFLLERELISYYGRINMRSGCLVNMTDGGEGASGQIQSESKREKIRASALGRKMTIQQIERHRTRMLKFRHTELSRAKISAANAGKKLSLDHIEAVRLAQRGRARTSEFIAAMSKRVVCIDTGDSFPSQQSAAVWAREHGMEAGQGSISNCCRGLRKTAGGLRWCFETALGSITAE